jgi:hypothetical protein
MSVSGAEGEESGPAQFAREREHKKERDGGK